MLIEGSTPVSTAVLVGAGAIEFWPGGAGGRRMGLRLRLRLRLGEVRRLGSAWRSSTGIGGVGAPGEREAATLSSTGQLAMLKMLLEADKQGRVGQGLAWHCAPSREAGSLWRLLTFAPSQSPPG